MAKTKASSTSLTLTLPLSEYERLSKLAKEKRMSLAQYILFCLEEKPLADSNDAMKKLSVE